HRSGQVSASEQVFSEERHDLRDLPRPTQAVGTRHRPEVMREVPPAKRLPRAASAASGGSRGLRRLPPAPITTESGLLSHQRTPVLPPPAAHPPPNLKLPA